MDDHFLICLLLWKVEKNSVFQVSKIISIKLSTFLKGLQLLSDLPEIWSHIHVAQIYPT